MIKVVEAFSGIGSQAKALSNIKKRKNDNGEHFEYEILNTIEWDINAILAYDLIHNGNGVLPEFKNLPKEELILKLSKYSLSIDGKDLVNPMYFNRFNEESLSMFLTAIKRTKNLVSITGVKATDLSDDIDIFTYSFPCQDLSLSGYFHGDTGGIGRDAENSSSMLWEMERILHDFVDNGKPLPKILIMENVTSIHSTKHIDNFNEWINSLSSIGYQSHYYDLQAIDFGLPQSRKRTFMISVLHNNDEILAERIKEMLNETTLIQYEKRQLVNELKPIESFLKTDYTNTVYLLEALNQVPNDTPSRAIIREKNPKIVDENNIIPRDTIRTITTRQDRHPNSGVILLDKKALNIPKQKTDFRYLTPRETFLFMGFEEKDFDNIVNNNFTHSVSRQFFSDSKLLKLSGNSIVVDVMEEVMKESIRLLEFIKNYN